MRRPRVVTLVPRLAVANLLTAQAPAKTADPFYLTPEHRAWREVVINRAGARCEEIDSLGRRCERSEANGDRMYADHVIEIADDGPRFDPANGMCRCAHHHTLKTNRERERRHAAAD